jgi:ribonucrease Y
MTFWIMMSLSFLLGIGITRLLQSLTLSSYRQAATSILQEAEKKAQLLKEEAFKEAQKEDYENKLVAMKELGRLKAQQAREEAREEALEKKKEDLLKKERQLRDKEETLTQKQHALQKEREILTGLTKQQARELVLQQAKEEAQKEINLFRKTAEQEAEEVAEQEACRLIEIAISRFSFKQTSESSLSLVPFSEEIKGRIIGPKGRNMRFFEETLGVTLHLENNTSHILISSYDSHRRNLAKNVLEELIQDGRITPQSIEELVKKHELLLENTYQTLGKKAADQLAISNLHPELLKVLGKLQFKSSLGQNVLDHSIEVASLMGSIAIELGLDAKKARRIGLLHDIGKALPAEDLHSHAISGMLFAKKYGEHHDVINGIGCHHDELSPSNPESMLIKACDALSASRAYARNTSKEEYLKKQETVESIAKNMHGVHSAYAIQGGKEVRVFVKPELISETESDMLAKSIAEKIEAEKLVPSRVRVTVIREKTSTCIPH